MSVRFKPGTEWFCPVRDRDTFARCPWGRKHICEAATLAHQRPTSPSVCPPCVSPSHTRHACTCIREGIVSRQRWNVSVGLRLQLGSLIRSMNDCTIQSKWLKQKSPKSPNSRGMHSIECQTSIHSACFHTLPLRCYLWDEYRCLWRFL